jgi:hypothetical protein
MSRDNLDENCSGNHKIRWHSAKTDLARARCSFAGAARLSASRSAKLNLLPIVIEAGNRYMT